MRHASQSGQQSSGAARRAKGASLVELLIVVAILLVILAIALPRLVAARATAQEASAVVFLRNLHAAQEQYYIVHGTYAATFAELEGYLASNGGALAPPQVFPVGLSPLRNSTMPTLAFLLLPAPDVADGSAYSGNGPKRPEGEDEKSGGGGAGSGAPAGGGGSNPPGKGNDDRGSGGGQNPGSGSGNDSNAPEQGGSPSGGKPDGSKGGVWSKADRITYQGYEFYLLRPNAHSWNCLAMPARNEHSGHHYFADQTGTIRREFGKPASAQSPAL
jgi:type II secretory pathway pseudopilin PulG